MFTGGRPLSRNTASGEAGIHLALEQEPGDSETLVTVEFHDLGGSTEIMLIHERFPNLEEQEKHSHGWTGCLDQLAKIFD